MIIPKKTNTYQKIIKTVFCSLPSCVKYFSFITLYFYNKYFVKIQSIKKGTIYKDQNSNS